MYHGFSYVAVCLLLSSIFTALHGMQRRSIDENSVCPSVRPSVCLSVTRVYCDKKVKRSVQIYIPVGICTGRCGYEDFVTIGSIPNVVI